MRNKFMTELAKNLFNTQKTCLYDNFFIINAIFDKKQRNLEKVKYITLCPVEYIVKIYRDVIKKSELIFFNICWCYSLSWMI